METEDLFLFPGALKPFSLLQHVCRIYYCRTVGEVGWGALSPSPVFGRSVNSIKIRGADYYVPHLNFQVFLRPCAELQEGDEVTIPY